MTTYRRSLRLRNYNYAEAGAYFVTICTDQRRCLFGNIDRGTLQLTRPGEITMSVWDSIPQRFAGVETDAMVVMPNHLHGVIILPDAPSRPLSAVVRVFKAASTRLIRTGAIPDFAWQQNYYEHVIRSEQEMDRIRQYIVDNPMQWQLDRENPDRVVVARGPAEGQRAR